MVKRIWYSLLPLLDFVAAASGCCTAHQPVKQYGKDLYQAASATRQTPLTTPRILTETACKRRLLQHFPLFLCRVLLARQPCATYTTLIQQLYKQYSQSYPQARRQLFLCFSSP
jgi:hypothetical protein